MARRVPSGSSVIACSSKASVSGAGNIFAGLLWRRGVGGPPRAGLCCVFVLCGLMAAGCPCVDIGPIRGVVDVDDGAGEGANESGELAYCGLKQLGAAMQVLPLYLSRCPYKARLNRNGSCNTSHTRSQVEPGTAGWPSTIPTRRQGALLCFRVLSLHALFLAKINDARFCTTALSML